MAPPKQLQERATCLHNEQGLLANLKSVHIEIFRFFPSYQSP